MDIKEAQRRAQTLGEEIARLIQAYERATGLCVRGIELRHVPTAHGHAFTEVATITSSYPAPPPRSVAEIIRDAEGG
jgi:hypothetical protein